MNTEDMALLSDPKIIKGLNNYQNVMANPVIPHLLELHKVELQDLTAMLETAAKFQSQRIQLAIISKLSNTSKTISFNTCDVDQVSLEDGAKIIINRLHRDYWIALTRTLGIIDVLPAIRSARKIIYEYTNSDYEDKSEFSLENIQKLFHDIEQYLSAETVLNQFKKYGKSLNIKESTKGDIRIEIVQDETSNKKYQTDEVFDLFMQLSTVLCTLVHDDWVGRLANNQVMTKGSLETIGSYIEQPKKNVNLILKLDSTIAAKFKEITGWCAV